MHAERGFEDRPMKKAYHDGRTIAVNLAQKISDNACCQCCTKTPSLLWCFLLYHFRHLHAVSKLRTCMHQCLRSLSFWHGLGTRWKCTVCLTMSDNVGSSVRVEQLFEETYQANTSRTTILPGVNTLPMLVAESHWLVPSNYCRTACRQVVALR